MKTYEGMEAQLHAAAALPPREEPTVAIGYEPRAGLDGMEKRKMSAPILDEMRMTSREQDTRVWTRFK
jgi:hypothetical protein